MKNLVTLKTYKKSNLYGMAVFASCILPYLMVPVIVSAVNLNLDSVPFYCFFIVAIYAGVTFNRAQFFIHDLSHNSLFETTKKNEQMGKMIGPLLGIYFPNYKRFHMLHHKSVGDANDPQIDDYFHEGTKTIGARMIFLVQPLIGYKFVKYLFREMGPVFGREVHAMKKPNLEFFALTMVYQLMIAAPGALTAHTALSAVIWLCIPLASAFTISMFLTRLRSVAEHTNNLGLQTHPNTTGHAKNWFDNILLYGANFNYHNVHHEYPHIPSRHYKTIATKEGFQTSNQSMFKTIFQKITAQ